MFNILLKCCVILSPLMITPIEGFWWRSTTTEAPPEPVMKQIPLTYFRTYTYQPLAGNPLPFPLMSSTDYITNYAALAQNPYFNSMISMAPAAVPITGNELTASNKVGSSQFRPSKNYGAAPSMIRSLNNGYLTTPPPTISTVASTTTSTKPKTTTTTTTTTPATTTTTTSTTSTTTTAKPSTTTTATPATSSSSTTENIKYDMESSSNAVPLIKADSLVNIDSAYPAFNRKVYTNHFNINYNRPVYPYPEYSVYKSDNKNNQENIGSNTVPHTGSTISTPPNIEFVPCMCPVNIQSGYPSPLTGNPSNSIFLSQGRTNSEVEADAGGEDLTSSGEDSSINPGEGQVQVPMPVKVEDLQVLRVNDGEDDEAEELKDLLS